jgi:hypothetical protein
MKPKHQGGYTSLHAELCERTLVTLLRGLGPWKASIYLIGGLVPRYLIASPSDEEVRLPHVGTTDVDIVLDLDMLAEVEAYRRLEENLRALGFVRGTNEEGNPQHYSWRKPIGQGITIVVDLLCDASVEEGGQVAKLARERSLSALKLPGAHLAINDYVEVEITAELLDGRGVATERVRVANIVPFIVLKALAYDDRLEQKDAYDLIYCLMYYQNGPADVGTAFAKSLQEWPDEPLLMRAIEILRNRFASDDRVPGYRKDEPTSYAGFLTGPGRRDVDDLNRRNASAVVERFLNTLEELRPAT